MYILSIPAFHWIKVPDSQTPHTPKPRAGHTCNLRDGQILVFGGYTGQQTPCESPGIWVFNASSLTWSSGFTSLPHPADHSPENHVLANSFGYKVPELVYKVIGGGSEGGATLTTPSAGQPTSGPFATGKPPIFTVTRSGSTATITQWGPGATTTDGIIPATPRDPKRGINGGLIAACIIAALAALAAGYLGYCAWLYRRQVRAYKSHLAVANRYYAPAATASTANGFLSAIFGRKSSKKSSKSGVSASGGVLIGEKVPRPESQEYQSQLQNHHRNNSNSKRLSTDTFDSAVVDGGAWAPTEPRTMFGGEDSSDRPSPGSGVTGATSTSGRASSSLQPSMMTRPAGWWREGGGGGGSGSGSGARTQNTGTGSGYTPDSVPQPRPVPIRRSGSTSGGSTSSTELLLDGQEPSFFSVVLGPRRALRVVNGLEGDGNGGNGGGGGGVGGAAD